MENCAARQENFGTAQLSIGFVNYNENKCNYYFLKVAQQIRFVSYSRKQKKEKGGRVCVLKRPSLAFSFLNAAAVATPAISLVLI